VLSDDLALTSDDMKYPSVAVGENADWHGVLPQEPEHGVCLQKIIILPISTNGSTTELKQPSVSSSG